MDSDGRWDGFDEARNEMDWNHDGRPDLRGPWYDLNGNGIVDSADLGFIQRNFLASDKGACCPAAASDADPSEPSVISRDELDSLGLPHLRAADADNDGMVTAEEILSFLQISGNALER